MKFHVHEETRVTLLNGRALGIIEARNQLSQWLDEVYFQKGEETIIPATTNLENPTASQWAWFVGTGKFKPTHSQMGIYSTGEESVVLIPVSTVETFRANCEQRAAAAATSAAATAVRQFRGGYATA